MAPQPPAAHNPATGKNTGAATDQSLFRDLQLTLQRRYDISQPHSVEQFISHDAETLRRLTGCKPAAPEMLLVREDGDSMDITLFLDKSLMTSINDRPWHRDWNGEHFNDYCTVLEGISHFVYLSWSAHYDRPVKMLELELQAEVDKFIVATLDVETSDTKSLIVRLFENVSYRSTLSAELRQRYRQANKLARHYCKWLDRNFDLSDYNQPLAAELARFYRTSGNEKLRHINMRLH